MPGGFRLTMAQLDPTLGDIAGNRDRLAASPDDIGNDGFSGGGIGRIIHDHAPACRCAKTLSMQ